MTAAGAKRNKQRGASDERDVARIIGGVRHLADTGGPEDVAHPLFAVQVKGGKTVTTATMRAGMASAIEAAKGTDKLPMLAIVDRSGSRLDRYVVFELHEFWAWLTSRDEEAASLFLDAVHARTETDALDGDNLAA